MSARSSISICGRPPIPRLPAPIAAKPCSMPANQRLRTDDVERLQDRRKHAIELDEEPSVGVAQPNSAVALPLQDNHLLAEHRNLGVRRACDVNGQTKTAKTNRRSPIIPSAYAIRSAPQRNDVFGTHTTSSLKPIKSRAE